MVNKQITEPHGVDVPDMARLPRATLDPVLDGGVALNPGLATCG